MPSPLFAVVWEANNVSTNLSNLSGLSLKYSSTKSMEGGGQLDRNLPAAEFRGL